MRWIFFFLLFFFFLFHFFIPPACGPFNQNVHARSLGFWEEGTSFTHQTRQTIDPLQVQLLSYRHLPCYRTLQGLIRPELETCLSQCNNLPSAGSQKDSRLTSPVIASSLQSESLDTMKLQFLFLFLSFSLSLILFSPFTSARSTKRSLHFQLQLLSN